MRPNGMSCECRQAGNRGGQIANKNVENTMDLNILSAVFSGVEW